MWYSALLVGVAVLCAALSRALGAAWRDGAAGANAGLVGALALSALGEWVQAPYLYKLYAFSGLTRAEIGSLFLFGHGAAAVLLALCCGLADRFGRRATFTLSALVFAAALACNRGSSVELQLGSRVLGVLLGAVLPATVEAHALHEHERVRGDDPALVRVLSLLALAGSLSAVAGSVLADGLAAQLGLRAPFDAAAALLALAAGVAARSWGESYGDRELAPLGSLAVAWVAVSSSPRLWLLGLVQACFETAAAVFTLSWAQQLEHSTDDEVPHMLVFACLMLSAAAGTLLFWHAQRAAAAAPAALRGLASPAQALKLSAALAAACRALPAFSQRHSLLLLALCGFQLCAGVFAPAAALLRARLVPPQVRATVLGLFRTPVQAALVLALLNLSQTPPAKVAGYSAALLALAAIGAEALGRLGSHDVPTKQAHSVL
jgi:hypothetical protein